MSEGDDGEPAKVSVQVLQEPQSCVAHGKSTTCIPVSKVATTSSAGSQRNSAWGATLARSHDRGTSTSKDRLLNQRRCTMGMGHREGISRASPWGPLKALAICAIE